MSKPTVWDQGRMSASRVTRLSVFLGSVLTALDLLVNQRLTLLFDLGLVALCVAVAWWVRPRGFFRVGVLPPLLVLGIVVVLAVVERSWVAAADDNVVQAVVSGLTHRSGGLFTAYSLALGILAVRQRVYSKRAGSPAPTRTTEANPSERSTTVVGSEPQTPQSITASSW